MTAIFCVLLTLAVTAGDVWPAFRGDGSSISAAQSLPLEWSADQNVAWTAPITGYGQSSPVVWQQKVFVTAAEGTSKEKLIVACYDLASGQRLWEQSLDNSLPQEVSDYISRAAPTPAVDAQRVYAMFESGDLLAFDHEGKLQWQRNLKDDCGTYQGNHGLGSSLAVTDAAVIVLYEHDGPSCLLAIDKRTGSDLWKADRPSRISWSSPIVAAGADGTQIIVSSAGVVEALSASDGQRIWWLEGLDGNTVPSATVTDELVIVGSSESDHNVAVRRGGAGDVSSTHLAWKSEEASSSFSSPLVYEGNVYLVNRAGVGYCVDLESGQVHWRERLPGSCWASPLGAEGRVYFFTREGATVVARAGEQFEQLAENQLPTEDRVYGVAAVEGAIIVREGSRLTRIGAAPNDGDALADASAESETSETAAPATELQELTRMSEYPDLPQGLTSFGAAIADGWLYVCGGHVGRGHEYSVDTQSDGFQRLSLTEPSEWEQLEPIKKLQGLALVEHAGQLYRLGGFEARNQPEDEQDLWSSAEVARYNPQSGQWQQLTAMPSPRSSFDAAVLGDRLYVVGGWAMQGADNEAQWQETALVADLTREPLVWQELPAPPFQRRALSVAAHNGKIFAMGGMLPEGKTTTAAHCFDPSSGKWTEAPSLEGKPLEGFGTAAFAVGGRLYVSTMEGRLQRLSSDGASWEVVGRLKAKRFFHRMLPLGSSELLAIGGADMEVGKVPSLEVLVPPKSAP